MTRVVLIGSSNLKELVKHLGEDSEVSLDSMICRVGILLAQKGCEVILLPDEGIPLEVAKNYIMNKGKKVYLTVPLNDREFGINHLEKFINEIYKLCEEFNVECEVINTGDWYRQDMTIGTYGEVLLVLGYSLGTLLELFGAFYLRSFFKRPVRILIVKEFVRDEELCFLLNRLQLQFECVSVHELHQCL